MVYIVMFIVSGHMLLRTSKDVFLRHIYSTSSWLPRGSLSLSCAHYTPQHEFQGLRKVNHLFADEMLKNTLGLVITSEAFLHSSAYNEPDCVI